MIKSLRALILFYLFFIAIPARSLPAGAPFENSLATSKTKVIAYLGADSGWTLTTQQELQLQKSLQHVTHVIYSFIRFNVDENGNTILNVTSADEANLNIIRNANNNVPILISIGGWGGRDTFGFLVDANKRKVFINSINAALSYLNTKDFNIKGIDVDWENELLASQAEIDGLGQFFLELRNVLGNKYIISNAVPATPAFWIHFPDAKIWAPYIDWSTIMAYDHYGTFGPTAEFSASLYDSNVGKQVKTNYPYPPTSANYAIQHYLLQGLQADKTILGIPFYCHSYYMQDKPSLHGLVVDPNVSSQVDYNVALSLYSNQLFQYKSTESEQNFSAPTYYGLIKLNTSSQKDIYRFMSCDSPDSVSVKMKYVSGENAMNKALAGVSFWSLLQDVDYDNNMSLLQALNKNIITP